MKMKKKVVFVVTMLLSIIMVALPVMAKPAKDHENITISVAESEIDFTKSDRGTIVIEVKQAENVSDTYFMFYSMDRQWDIREDSFKVNGVSALFTGRASSIDDEGNICASGEAKVILDKETNTITADIKVKEAGEYLVRVAVFDGDNTLLETDKVIFKFVDGSVETEVTEDSEAVKEAASEADSFDIAKTASENAEETTAETEETQAGTTPHTEETVAYETHHEPDIDTSSVVTGGVYVVASDTVVTPDNKADENISTVVPANVTRPENYVNGGSQIQHPANYRNNGSYTGTTAATPVVTEDAAKADAKSIATTSSSDAKKTLDEKRSTGKDTLVSNASDDAKANVKVPSTGKKEVNRSAFLWWIIPVILVGVGGILFILKKHVMIVKEK